MFNQDGAKYVPAESVYAVLEVRQEFNGANVAYAAEKAASVRKLRRTSAPIPHAGGKFDPIVPPPILAGILTLDSEWKPAFGKPRGINFEPVPSTAFRCRLRIARRGLRY